MHKQGVRASLIGCTILQGAVKDDYLEKEMFLYRGLKAGYLAICNVYLL